MKIELELDEYIAKLTKAYKDGFSDGYNMKSINYTPVTYKESWKPEKEWWKPEWVYRQELQPTYYSDKVTCGPGVNGIYTNCKVTGNSDGTGNVTLVNPGEVK